MFRIASLRPFIAPIFVSQPRLKDESQKPQEMRYRCIMAGFDPDTPEEMQEFIRVSTLFLWRISTESESNFLAKKLSISGFKFSRIIFPRQALEDEHPLPNVVPQAVSAGDFWRKLSRTWGIYGKLYVKLIWKGTLKGQNWCIVLLWTTLWHL